jgi:hypothetical protein
VHGRIIAHSPALAYGFEGESVIAIVAAGEDSSPLWRARRIVDPRGASRRAQPGHAPETRRFRAIHLKAQHNPE